MGLINKLLKVIKIPIENYLVSSLGKPCSVSFGEADYCHLRMFWNLIILDEFYRDHFELKSDACLGVLKHVLLTYPSIALGKESLEMLYFYLYSKTVTRVGSAIDVLLDLTIELGSNEDVKAFVKKELPCLFSNIKNPSRMTVLENSLQLLFIARNNRHVAVFYVVFALSLTFLNREF